MNGDLQRERVFERIAHGEWFTLESIAKSLGYPTQSVSARVRDFRKAQYGGHTVERRAVDGVGPRAYAYRLVLRTQAAA